MASTPVLAQASGLRLSMGAAMKASEVLQSESTKASDIMEGMAIQSLAANFPTTVWSTWVLNTEVMMTPMVKYMPVSRKSRMAVRMA